MSSGRTIAAGDAAFRRRELDLPEDVNRLMTPLPDSVLDRYYNDPAHPERRATDDRPNRHPLRDDSAQGDESLKRNKVVYLWLDRAGAPRYVGKGSLGRAYSHADGTHNPGFQAWLAGERDPDLKVSGPYTDHEALLVEAALISALSETKVPLFNDHPGTGPRFARQGVPEDKVDRLTAEPLSESEIARQTGGALFVMTPSGFKPFKPLGPDPVEPVARAVEQAWQLGTFIDEWRSAPASGPKVVIGVSGPIGRRFVIGAFAIDATSWGAEQTRVGRLWRVPLCDRTNADAHDLQGRRVSNAKFGNGKHLHFHWYDASGALRPYVGRGR